MIEGARGRVPEADHWDLYRQARQEHAELLESLSQVISVYAADKDEWNSTAAGATILDRWAGRDEWNRCFPGQSSQLFGMVMWVAIFDDEAHWRVTCETVDEREVRVYRRVNRV